MASDDLTARRWHLLAEGLGAEALPLIADIGANPLDDPPYKPLLQAGLCRIHGFEPQPDAFAELERRKGPGESYENCALGDGGTHPFHIYRGSGLSSLRPLDRASMAFLGRPDRPATLVETPKVETRRLDDVAPDLAFDLVKIDVQGAETMIFAHAAERLAHCVAVVTELRFFPLYEGEATLDGQMALLGEAGLRFHKFLFVKNQMIAHSRRDRVRPRAMASQALDGDAVFVRDLRAPEAVSDARLKALALLADAVFASHDLVLHVLDLLAARGAVAADLIDRYLAALPDGLRKAGP